MFLSSCATEHRTHRNFLIIYLNKLKKTINKQIINKMYKTYRQRNKLKGKLSGTIPCSKRLQDEVKKKKYLVPPLFDTLSIKSYRRQNRRKEKKHLHTKKPQTKQHQSDRAPCSSCSKSCYSSSSTLYPFNMLFLEICLLYLSSLLHKSCAIH